MRRLALLGLVLAGCTEEPSLPSATIGDDTAQVAIADRGTTFAFSRGGRTLLTFPADALQLGTVNALDKGASYDPYWLVYGGPNGMAPPAPPADLRWQKVSSTALALVGGDAVVKLHFDGGSSATLTLHIDAPGRIRANFTPDPSGPKVAYMRLRPRTDENEGFYGLGEWEDSLNHRGKLRPMQLEVAPESESFDNEAHVPIPLLIGTRGWGLFVESRRVGLFDVATQAQDLVEVTYGTADDSADGLAFDLFAADAPLDITKHYYDLEGQPRLPAEWALGPWIWRDENRDQAQVLDDLQQIRNLDLATSAIWLDRPYATAVNTFDYDPAKFTDPAAMIDAVHAAGLRLAVWSTPYLENAAEPYHDQAVANGYFIPTPGILLNGWSAPIDFTNQAAYSFWQGLIHKYTDNGIEGFKLDYGEDIVPALRDRRSIWKFSDGSDERTGHYQYTISYHRVYQEALSPQGSFLLCRAGRWGDQQNVSVIWPGDMDATFTKHGESFTDASGTDVPVGVGGLPATVIMGVGLGPSGFPFFGADTGGYRHSPADKELYIRWFEQTALSTVMQVGDASSQTPWEFAANNGRDQETLDDYRVYARLHMRLFPYEWTYAQNIATDGRAITRPFGLAWPALNAHPDDQYMFGDDLLVAPVLTRGATTRDVILPPGEWIDWWDGTVYDGGAAGGSTVTVPAPLGKLPLLVRAGAIVPLLRPTIDTLSPATDPDIESFADDSGILYVRIAPGHEKSTFTLYDGTTINAAATANSTKYHSGNTGFIFKSGSILELIDTRAPLFVFGGDGHLLPFVADPAALAGATEGWSWDSSTGGTTWIRLPPGMQDLTVLRGK